MRGPLIFIAAFATFIWFMFFGPGNEHFEKMERENKAQEGADLVPRIVTRSPDGCNVYAFKSGGRWRYFTRCGAQTTTDNNYTITRSSGKTSHTETVEDSITTDTNQPKDK